MNRFAIAIAIVLVISLVLASGCTTAKNATNNTANNPDGGNQAGLIGEPPMPQQASAGNETPPELPI